ncbi:hypothetical protein DFH09DRAFT_1119076 [Mycena vulgaris]|nr:hypothetical protein DFH09DRAFT_1119076 [Mycena vulgaris]
MLPVRDVGPQLDSHSLKLFYLEITAEAASYGAFVIIAILSMSSLVQKGLRNSYARQSLLTITIAMLLSATLHLGLHLPNILLQLPGTDDTNYVDPTPTLKKLNVGQTSLRRLIYFLSDIIVVWRAWAIWTDSLVVQSVLAVCLLATLVTSLILFVFNVDTIQNGHHYETLTQNFLGTFCLLVTNFTATGLIGYKLWYYRHNLKQYLNRGNRTTKVESVLVLLLESGGLYCAFWILVMVGDFGYFKDFGLEWFQPNISGIYPTVVILVVSNRKMLSEEVFTYSGPGLGLATLGNIRTWMPTPFPSNEGPPGSDYGEHVVHKGGPGALERVETT